MADTSPSAADYERPTQQTEHPAQQTFTENEQTFLQKYLDDYLAAEPSNNKKGDKKCWVKMHVYYDYITEFKSDGPSGPNLSSLFEVSDMCVPPLTSNWWHFQKMVCWYSNKSTASHVANTKTVLIVTPPIKKPRATNAEDLFAKNHKDDLRAAVSLKMEQDSGSAVPGANLVMYHNSKKEAYRALSEPEKAKWEGLARAHNDNIKAPPSMDYFYEYVILIE